MNVGSQSILIVDDNHTNIQVLSEVLDPSYTCIFATSGMDALRLVESDKPDLILLDIMMPGMDGYEVCSRLKENMETMEIPVIFISAAELADIAKLVEILAAETYLDQMADLGYPGDRLIFSWGS